MERKSDTTRIRVALVDDSDDVRYLLATVLEVDGRFEVVGEAHAPDEALAMIAEDGPDLVLIDLQMDGWEGTWLVKELRRRGGDVVLAVVTASADPEDHAAAIAAGADAVHNKMSMTSTMMDELAELVARRVDARC